MEGSKRGTKRIDLAVGITLGIVLGFAVIIAFVFYGSEGTIDAPRISGVNTGKPTSRPKSRSRPAPKRHPVSIPTVRVISGAPPPMGPTRLHFRRGELVRFRILTDGPIGVEIPGYGIDQTVESSADISFRARRSGQFPVILTVSHINVAELRIAP